IRQLFGHGQKDRELEEVTKKAVSLKPAMKEPLHIKTVKTMYDAAEIWNSHFLKNRNLY
ncbi:hypothetical protein PV326_002218, partial [Microctonus aethiopoides]